MPSEKNKEIARFLRDLFDTTPSVRRVVDKDETAFLDIAVVTDFPEPGVVSYSTLGMSDVVLHDEDGAPLDFRMEITASNDTGTEIIPDLLFEVYKYAKAHPEWSCSPGNVLRNLITPWKPDSIMQHVYFTGSFFIEALSELHRFGDEHVIWTMMIPISQAELEFLEANGDDAFETMLEDGGANILDFDRDSLL